MKQIIAAAIVCVALIANVHAEPVMHAGEWESHIGDGPVRRICIKSDRPFDSATLIKMNERAGGKCTLSDVNTTGPAISYVATCDIAGGHMTLHGTITFNGEDNYTSRSQSHYEGGPIKMPDMDMSVTSHRLGPCQPGDIQSQF